jgi:hypothetical protein
MKRVAVLPLKCGRRLRHRRGGKRLAATGVTETTPAYRPYSDEAGMPTVLLAAFIAALRSARADTSKTRFSRDWFRALIVLAFFWRPAARGKGCLHGANRMGNGIAGMERTGIEPVTSGLQSRRGCPLQSAPVGSSALFHRPRKVSGRSRPPSTAADPPHIHHAHHAALALRATVRENKSQNKGTVRNQSH